MNEVCAILVNYRGAADIAQAVAGLLRDEPALDVVVVDNSEDRDEWQLLRRLLPGPARCVRSPGNLGFGQGCNLALQHTAAPFVFLVNPDVQVLPGCTGGLVQALRQRPDLAAVAPRQYLDPGCRWLLAPAWLPTALRAWAGERGLRDDRAARRLRQAAHAENLRLWTARQVVPQRALSGGAMMVRRSALPAGEALFDPRFFMYFEDSDLCLRLRRRGLGLGVVPQARAVHAWRNQPHKAQLMAAGSRAYFDKHYGPDDPWLARSRRLAAAAPAAAGPAWERFGPDGEPAGVEREAGWVLELSLGPLFLPAVGRLGQGAWVPAPLEVLASVLGAPLYGRLSAITPAGADSPVRWFHWPGAAPAERSGP